MPRTLEALRKVGAPSFLTVLKRFGPSNPAPLSFPMPGWTLAADVSAAVPGLLETLNQLDEEVAAAGGRLYLAKDSRQSRKIASISYPKNSTWRDTLIRLAARNTFSSQLFERINYFDQNVHLLDCLSGTEGL